MSKKEKLMKGFSNLLQSTEIEENKTENNISNKNQTSKSLNIKTVKRLDSNTANYLDVSPSKQINSQTANHLDAHTSKHLNTNTSLQIPPLTSELLNAETPKQINSQTAKYKEFKKCTLYLPSNLMDKLSYMKILTKKDLSVLTAEAIQDYLIKNNVKDII